MQPDLKFKFVDDLSILEILNLLSVGVCSYNFRKHIASDIGIEQLFLPTERTNSQKSFDTLQQWTAENLQKVNPKKSTVMM